MKDTSKYNNYLTDKEKETIISMNKDGYNTVQIAEALGRSDSAIGRYLRGQNIHSSHSPIQLTPIERESIIEMYRNGKPAREILSLFSDRIKCENTIMTIVKEAGIGRPNGKVTNADITYFDVIDTEAKAYYLGLMLTDSNVHKLKERGKSYAVQIALQMNDLHIIESFKNELKSTNKISLDFKKNQCHFAVHSAHMAQSLISKNVIPQKSTREELYYNIPEHLFRHYIRGIFDGDGTVFMRHNKYLRFGFYGTHKLIDQVQTWLGEQIGISQNKIFDKPTVSMVIYQKKLDVRNFYHLLYDNANFFLKRKKQLFDNYISELDKAQ